MIVGRVLRELAVGVQSLQSWGSWGRSRKHDAHHGAGPASIPSARGPSRAARHGFGFQVHRPVCIVGAGRRLDRFTFRFAGSSRLAAAPPRSFGDMGKTKSRKTKSKNKQEGENLEVHQHPPAGGIIFSPTLVLPTATTACSQSAEEA